MLFLNHNDDLVSNSKAICNKLCPAAQRAAIVFPLHHAVVGNVWHFKELQFPRAMLIKAWNMRWNVAAHCWNHRVSSQGRPVWLEVHIGKDRARVGLRHLQSTMAATLTAMQCVHTALDSSEHLFYSKALFLLSWTAYFLMCLMFNRSSSNSTGMFNNVVFGHPIILFCVFVFMAEFNGDCPFHCSADDPH